MKELTWKDDGGGNYRVSCNIWKVGENNGLTTRYDYTFNADRSGGFLCTEWLTNQNLQYRTEWKSNGSGALTVIAGANLGTYTW